MGFVLVSFRPLSEPLSFSKHPVITCLRMYCIDLSLLYDLAIALRSLMAFAICKFVLTSSVPIKDDNGFVLQTSVCCTFRF